MYGLILVSLLLKLSQCSTVIVSVTKTEKVVLPYYVTVVSEANGNLATLPQCQAPVTYVAPASAGSAATAAVSPAGSSAPASGSSSNSKPAAVVASASRSSSSSAHISSHTAAPLVINLGSYHNTTHHKTTHHNTTSNYNSTTTHLNSTSSKTSITVKTTSTTSKNSTAVTTSKSSSVKITSTVLSKATTSNAASTNSTSSSKSSRTPTPTTPVGVGVVPSAVLGYHFKDDKPVDPKQEGKSILDSYWSKLWTGEAFADRYNCGGKTDTPVVWPVAVAFQGYVDGEKAFPGQYTNKLNQIYNMLMNYYNPTKKGCSASTNKDNDIYYDDNAQIASALITAYEATKDQKYLDRGSDVVDFLMTGWNDTTGGVTWHLGSPYVASISTTETALACLRLYENKKDDKYLKFGQKSMDWLREKLWDKDNNLIYDGITGNNVNKNMEFSYQVGTAISAYIKLYQQTKDEKYKQYSTALATAGINRNLVIYNRDVDKSLRFWRDELDFTQLLFEGLTDYYKIIDKNDDIKNEVAREARYVYDFARNSVSGLYFNTVNPWGNGDQNYAIWKSTGATQKSAVNAAGFCDGKTSGTYKSKLITGGAAARVFFMTARSVSKI